MKKVFVLSFVLVASFALMGCDACKENVLDKVGDSVASLGKKGMEKEQVLAQRKAARASKCAEQKGAEMKKKIGL